MKHTCASICDGLPTLFANHPWWFHQSQMLQNNDNRDHIIYTTRDPPSKHRYQIPPFLGRRIRGCFHGWVVLSDGIYNDDMWSLWNPVTCKIIRLPRLIFPEKEKGCRECCLSSPPDDRGSIFMLTSDKKQTIVFCRLDRGKKRYKWVEMSYANQMRSLEGFDAGFLCGLTCCNGKVYALNSTGGRISSSIILIDIAVKGTEVVISLLRYTNMPPTNIYMNGCSYTWAFLKGCCTELFLVKIHVIHEVEKKTVGEVFVFKFDVENKKWIKMEDLKDSAMFLNLAQGNNSIFYSPAIGSELGGKLHLLDRCGVIHSYDFKNKTVALVSMPTHYPSSSERCRLQEEDTINNTTMIEEGNMESRLLSIPFDVLKTIVEFCVGVEYLNFRAVCKKCHLAAPMIRWSSKKLGQTYSLVSPWLMVLEKGVTSFTDPMSGDKYFIKTPCELIGNVRILCSMYGWLLIRSCEGPLMFFNPFTSDIRHLPDDTPYLDAYYFSAPPTSSDCMVVGFKTWGECHVYVLHVAAREPWLKFRLGNFSGAGSRSFFHFATLYARNLYALYYNGEIGFIDTDHYTWRKVLAKGPSSSGCRQQIFLMKCDQQLLQVIMGKFGRNVEVFKLNNDSTEWEMIESLGRHAIYICGKSCLCIEAKVATMANKIYFPRVHSKNRKIVFYSLETRRYHTHTSNVEEECLLNFVGTTYHVNPHVWIEPSWY